MFPAALVHDALLGALGPVLAAAGYAPRAARGASFSFRLPQGEDHDSTAFLIVKDPDSERAAISRFVAGNVHRCILLEVCPGASAVLDPQAGASTLVVPVCCGAAPAVARAQLVLRALSTDRLARSAASFQRAVDARRDDPSADRVAASGLVGLASLSSDHRDAELALDAAGSLAGVVGALVVDAGARRLPVSFASARAMGALFGADRLRNACLAATAACGPDA